MAQLEYSATLQTFGITLRESDRYNAVSRLFGNPLAESEFNQNLKSYDREFLRDEAVSLPHTYHHIRNELYSQFNEHPLFNVKNQIDRRERGGETYRGFEKYEAQIASTPIDTVNVWYSPDGPSGFEGVNFDAGRLYIGFKTAEDQSIHFDIKVRPQFPILSLLGNMQEQINGTHPLFDSPEVGKMYYLTHPIQTAMGVNEFFAYMEQYADREKSPVYISRRNSKNPEMRTLSSTMHEMKKMLEKQGDEEVQIFEPVGDKTTTALMREEDLMRRYFAVIQPYVEKNNGTYTLYGCSTTSTVGSEDVQGLIAQNSFENVVSLYSTQHRLLTNNPPPVFEVQKNQYDDYKCPHCETTLRGELRGKPETWKKECPHCHEQLHCAN